MANKKAETTPTKSKVVFSKAKTLTLKRYAGRRDLLAQLLKDGKDYTLDQVDALIQNFMKKGKVK